MSRARTITVDGREYCWRRVRDRDFDERVSVWCEQKHQALVMIRFARMAARYRDFGEGLLDVGGWVTSGVRVYNLNRPAVVAGLIRAALARGWAPQGRGPLTLNGFALLRERPNSITPEPLSDPWLELATQLLERRAAADEKPALAWLREHTEQAWTSILRRPPEQVALTLAGLIEFGLVLEQPSTLTRAQLADLVVLADQRQAAGRFGGLALATWLNSGSLGGEAELSDFRKWCEALLGSTITDGE